MNKNTSSLRKQIHLVHVFFFVCVLFITLSFFVPGTSRAVDEIPPTIQSISADQENGTYGVGTNFTVYINFSERVVSTREVIVTFETGDIDRTCTFMINNEMAGSCVYTVQAGDTTDDLTILSIVGEIRDMSDNAMTQVVPEETVNLAANYDYVIDTTAPSVISLSPINGATNVSADVELNLRFNEIVSVHEGFIKIKKKSDDSVVETLDTFGGQVGGSETQIININPLVSLGSLTEYYIIIARGIITDIVGNEYEGILDADTWAFTIADVGSPAVSEYSPVSGAVNVAVDTNLILTFDETVAVGRGNIVIKKKSNDSTIETIDVASDLVTGGGTRIVTINPRNNLASGVEYYVAIDEGAFEDESSNTYAGISDSSTWSFTTVPEPARSSSRSSGSTLSGRISALNTLGAYDLVKELINKYIPEQLVSPVFTPAPVVPVFVPAPAEEKPEVPVLPVTPKLRTVFDLDKNLTVGATGEDVKILQGFLIAKQVGFATTQLAFYGVTGYFGEITRATLAEYQASVGIFPSEGFFGPITRDWIQNQERTPDTE